MVVFLGVGLGIGVLASLIMPWVNSSRISDLHRQVQLLKKQLAALQAENIPVVTNAAPAPVVPPPVLAKSAPPVKPAAKQKRSFEQQFGARLPVWIGGVALALAGFFLVKYSIEIGLLSPQVRVLLGLAFGGALLKAGHWLQQHPKVANGARIAQALSGAGIADLYLCLFAATSLYHMVPQAVGFLGMAGVTAGAAVLSLRHGMPIAVLGLVGGFLTPALMGSHDPHAGFLFGYLYLLVAGMLRVIQRQRWWVLALPSVAFSFLWVVLWLANDRFQPQDSTYLGLFLLALSATVIHYGRDHVEGNVGKDTPWWSRGSVLGYTILAGSVGLMALVVGRGQFGLFDWGLFALLALGGMALAYAKPRIYGYVPFLSMGVNAAMIPCWNQWGTVPMATILLFFGALYTVCGYALAQRSEKPLPWALLASLGSLGYYLLAYAEFQRPSWLHSTADTTMDTPMFWGLLAAALCVLSAGALRRVASGMADAHPHKQGVMAAYTATATTFLALALTIELPREFLSVALAGELIALCWLDTRLSIRALRPIAGAVAVGFAFVLLPQILLLIQLTAYSLFEAQLPLQERVPMVEWPLFQLGLPAVFFALGSVLLRSKKDDRLVQVLEVAAIALTGTMGYYLTRHLFHVDENVLFAKAGFVERGTITNILFAYGVLCLGVGRYFTRRSVSWAGLALAGIAVFRLCYFDLGIANPLWSSQNVGEWPIANALLLTYGLSMAWTWATAREMRPLGRVEWMPFANAFLLVLGFVLISFEVRQWFHGAVLNVGSTGNAEIYSYSVAWLLYGIGLLLYGTVRADRAVRVGSLGVMILTVGKVFLYDASELTGLFRVFSFFGLGLSLLGLSWFYTRYVFGKKE